MFNPSNFLGSLHLDRQVKDTIKRENSKEKLKFSLLVSSQQSCRDISPFTLLRSKAMLTLFVLKDVVQVGHDGLQVFPNLSVIQFIDVFGCQGG